ncbi:MAG: hypothetical protein KDH98_25380, partial [Calditrichaeota bacterium]|nr:hypothetical protein [Calditrichota bacterium]
IKTWQDVRMISEFPEPQFPVSFTEIKEEWEWKVSKHLKTWQDYLMQENHSLTFEQATEILAKNRERNGG